MSQLIPSPETAFRKKYRNLAEAVVDSVMQSIQAGALKPGDKLPTESAIKAMYGVSRTVVREALSHLQAAGHVQTRHGIGTFVIEKAPAMLGVGIENILAMRDVLAILELRIGMETEAAWLAATRRSEEQLAQMRATLAAMRASAERGDSTVEADRRFHLLVAQATGNRYFEDILAQLGSAIIPRARLNTADLAHDDPAAYLARLQREHEDILDAIARQDAESARAAMRMHLSHSRERLRLAQEQIENAQH
jgi:GntR family transcriptional repressor for pyruvate dehydrogenase complex